METFITVHDPYTSVASNRGAVFIARQVPHVSKCHVYASILEAGSMAGPIGAAHLLEHCKLPKALKSKIEKQGCYLTGSAGSISTSFFADGPGHCAEHIISSVSTAVSMAEFDEQHFFFAHNDVHNEYAQDSMNEDKKQIRLKLRAAFAPDLSARYETHTDIDALTLTDMIAFFSAHYLSDQLIVAIEGPLESRRMLDVAMKQFILPRGHKDTRVKFNFQPSTLVARMDQVPSTQVFLLFDSSPISYDPREEFLFQTARRFLSSALYYALIWNREYPLVRSIQGTGVTPDNHFHSSGYTFVARPQNLAQIFEVIADTVKSTVENDIEITKAIQHHLDQSRAEKRGRTVTIGTSNLVESAYSAQTIYPHDYVMNRLDDVTPEMIRETIANNFLNTACSLVYRGHIEDKYPDHAQVAEMFQISTAAKRTPETDKNLAPNAGSPSLSHR